MGINLSILLNNYTMNNLGFTLLIPTEGSLPLDHFYQGCNQPFQEMKALLSAHIVLKVGAPLSGLEHYALGSLLGLGAIVGGMVWWRKQV